MAGPHTAQPDPSKTIALEAAASGQDTDATVAQGGRVAYHPLTILIHWLTAALVILPFAIAWIALRMPDNVALRLLVVHEAAGASILLITLLRLCWRAYTGPGPALTMLPRWQVTAARIVQGLLLLLLIIQPILGWLTAAAANLLPPALANVGWLHPVAPDKQLYLFLAACHYWSARLLLALLALHIAAALYHHWVRRDDILRRMVSWR